MTIQTLSSTEGVVNYMDDNPDYVTLLPTNVPRWYLVVVMTFHRSDDDYAIRKCSGAMRLHAAKGLAQSWAASLGLTVRIGHL